MLKRYVCISCVLFTGCANVEWSEEEVGANSQDIVGGVDANIVDYPWQVSFQSSSGFHFCGGSILNERWVLTAQHCVAESGQFGVSSPSTVRVAAGSSKLSTMGGEGQIVAVDDIFPFPGYADTSEGKDVALLHLAAPLSFSSKVAPIAPATAADAAAGLTDPGVVTTVTGWGALSSGGASPDILQTVDVPIVSNEVADAAYPENITADQLAAGDMVNGGEDSCQGDSGGPLIVSKGSGVILAGVVSWGYGCAEAQYPGMYARVSSFDTWIAGVSDGEPVALTSVTGQAGAQDTFKHFAVNVPAGTPALNVHQFGGTGDGDLYVRFGSEPTESAYDCRPYQGSNNESCSIENPAAGTWYISIHGYSAYSGVSLKATSYDTSATPPPPPVEICGDGLDNDLDGLVDCNDSDCDSDPVCSAPEPVTYHDNDVSLPKDKFKHYPAFQVTPGTPFKAFLDRLSNNPDLYVRFGAVPTPTEFDCRPFASGSPGDETCDLTVPGNVTQVYVSVRGRAATSQNRYNLAVTYTPAQ